MHQRFLYALTRSLCLLLCFSFARVGHDDPLDADEQKQQGAGSDFSPPGEKIAVKGNQRRNNGFQQHAEQGADHVSHAAGQQRAADDRAGDDLQLAALKGQIPAAFHIQGVGHARQHGTEAVEAVNQNLGFCHGQAHQFGGLFVSADRVYVPAEAGFLQKHNAYHDHDQEQEQIEIDKADRLDLHPLAVLQVHEIHLPLGQRVHHGVGNVDGFPADQGANAPGQEHARQRGDEGRHVQIVDGRAHQQPQTNADHHGGQNADQRVKTQHRIAVGNEHARQRRYRAHAQVNAAGDQHHRHAHGGDAVIGIVDEHVHKGAQGGEALGAVGDCAEEIDDQENADGGVYHDILGVRRLAQQALLFHRLFLKHIQASPFTAADMRS